MTIRPATLDDLPALRDWLGESHIDLLHCIVMVAEDNGALVGMLPGRLVWEMEPGLVRGHNKTSKSRALLGMYQAMEDWLRSPANRSGVREVYTHTISPQVRSWAPKLGWSELYTNTFHYYKHL